VTQTPVRPVYGSVTLHGGRRVRPRRGAAIVAVALAVTAAASVVLVRHVTVDSRRDYLSTDGWPRRGQGAYQLGADRPHASADETPVPIASLAKVMTAYLVLAAAPLAPRTDGPNLQVSSADVADTERRRAEDQSVVTVRAGETLSERQALMAVLLPSANNIAVMVTRYSSNRVADFVAAMNRTAHALGMRHTTYTDPSGFDPRTVSTAADQLILAREAAGNRVLARMMATTSFRLPVVGTVRNTDSLLGRDGFVGMKTGSDDDAGGCFMFHTRRRIGGHAVDLFGVVLGQRGHNLIAAGLYAARQLAGRIAPAAA
jgi:serine-type D-Ala-D-Ala carboxypeptidase (penicillin-binding protein 5/6)